MGYPREPHHTCSGSIWILLSYFHIYTNSPDLVWERLYIPFCWSISLTATLDAFLYIYWYMLVYLLKISLFPSKYQKSDMWRFNNIDHIVVLWSPASFCTMPVWHYLSNIGKRLGYHSNAVCGWCSTTIWTMECWFPSHWHAIRAFVFP